jgi:electron transfer flavoprotein alpha subunit
MGRDPRHDILFEPVRIGPKTLRNRATVAPRTYVALGVSGALPHLVGMAGSETVVAVNLDRRARIFEYADLGIAGDAGGLIDALLALREPA